MIGYAAKITVRSALCAGLLALPQFIDGALTKNEEEPPVMLEAQEKLVFDDAAKEPVTFFIAERNSETGLPGFDEKPFENVEKWQIQIFDTQDNKVSYIQGGGRPDSLSLPWSGLSRSGKPLPDGFYKARLAWIDSNKKRHATPKITVSLLTPPEIQRLSVWNIQLSYAADGMLMRIPEIVIFEPGAAEFKKSILPALKEMAALLKLYPKNSASVRGHTDSSGTRTANIALSKKRAFAVYKYFIQNGIEKERLTYEGAGYSEPIDSNSTAEGRAKNRRVDVLLLKNA